MKNKYILFSDAKSSHTLKWLKELIKYYDIYLVSLNGYRKEILDYISRDRLLILNESVNQSGGNVKLISKYFALQKLIKEIKPKYINAHYLSSYGIIAALIKRKYPKIKLIQSTWGTDILVTPFENFFKRKVAAFALNIADLITSDSYFMSDKIKELSNNGNILTFPFGLDSIDLNQDYKKDENLIFSNRALIKNYNIDKIIEWFLNLDNKELKLIIANDGNMKDELENFVKSNNLTSRVEFVGFLNQSEQREIYKKAKYYISIPSSDSTAVSLLEAMSYGCIPIVSNIPANREWIIGGCNGIFWNKELRNLNIDNNAAKINQEIISKKAIFSNSIRDFVNKVSIL